MRTHLLSHYSGRTRKLHLLNLRSRSLFSTQSGGIQYQAPRPEARDQFYYTQDKVSTQWPDPLLGIFSPTDPRFRLPGHVGVSGRVRDPRPTPPSSSTQTPLFRSDLLTHPTHVENHAQVLYSAHDFIKFSAGEEEVCSDLLDDEFPEFRGMPNLICETHEAPELLKREVQPLFPNRDVQSGTLSVITLLQHTDNDMSVWSNEMEEEREKMTENFFSAAKEIVARIKEEGFWADFIDPSSGIPYYSQHTSTTMFETDEKYRLLGFRIEDLGCCKVICHKDFGRNVFVGTIFTDVHVSMGIIDDLFCELKLNWHNLDLNLTEASHQEEAKKS